MLDVHPPEHAAHTWRDFFIHIATIVVGLLIAVGLEQTVEFLHHRHQRHDLMESLESDTDVCRQDGLSLAAHHKAIAAFLLDREKRVNAALLTGHPLTQLPDPPPVQAYMLLSYTHFQEAKASGLLQLLSTEEMDAFSEVNFDVELTAAEVGKKTDATYARRAFEASFFDSEFKSLDLSRASPADLRDYLRLLENERRLYNLERFYAVITVGAADAVLSGKTGIRKLQQAEDDAVAKDKASLN